MSEERKIARVLWLLTTKEGRMVVLIPLAIILIFFGYNIYSENFSNKPERIAMDDGTVRLHRNAGIGKLKLPKELGDMQNIVNEDLKIVFYDVNLDKNNNVTSAVINTETDKNMADIIAVYKGEYKLDDDLVGSVDEYQLSLSYIEVLDSLRIEIDKQ